MHNADLVGEKKDVEYASVPVILIVKEAASRPLISMTRRRFRKPSEGGNPRESRKRFERVKDSRFISKITIYDDTTAKRSARSQYTMTLLRRGNISDKYACSSLKTSRSSHLYFRVFLASVHANCIPSIVGSVTSDYIFGEEFNKI